MPYCILKKTQIDLASFLISYNKNCHFVYLSPSESMLVCLNVESETYYGPKKKSRIQLKGLFLIDSSCLFAATQWHAPGIRDAVVGRWIFLSPIWVGLGWLHLEDLQQVFASDRVAHPPWPSKALWSILCRAMGVHRQGMSADAVHRAPIISTRSWSTKMATSKWWDCPTSLSANAHVLKIRGRPRYPLQRLRMRVSTCRTPLRCARPDKRVFL